MISNAKKKGIMNEIFINREKYFLVAPYALFFFIFVIIPIISSLFLSFTDFNMLQIPKFTGISNYLRLFLHDDVFLKAIKNTILLAFLTGPLSYLLCLMLAWFINELSPKIRAFMTLVFYAPSLAGNVFFIWTYIFSSDKFGFINANLIRIGIIQEPILWLNDPQYIMTIVIIVQLWLSLGTGFLAFVAGLQSVDRTLYEAGAVDGIKNRWQEFWHITLPSMKPLLLFGAIMQIAVSFSVAAVPMALAGFPSTDDAAVTIVSHIMDNGLLRYEMGYASAIATFLFLIMVLSRMVISSLIRTDD